MQGMTDLPIEKHPLPELNSDLQQKVKSNFFYLTFAEVD